MRAVTDDVIGVLEAGSLTVGDTTGEGLTAPFVVVYPIGDGFLAPGFGGSLGEPWSQVDAGIQVTCVGVSREQAQWLEDRATALLVAHVGDWWVQLDGSPAVSRDDDTGGPPLFYAYPRFSIHTEGL